MYQYEIRPYKAHDCVYIFSDAMSDKDIGKLVREELHRFHRLVIDIRWEEDGRP